jgi:membrane associated rhomboid family serine protease
MRQTPPLTALLRYPVTTTIGVAAVAVSLASWAGVTLDYAVREADLWTGRLWPLVASALPHVDVIHLAFNLYWLWVFGTLVEDALGAGWYAGLAVLFAAGGSAAELGVGHQGVGLSGVGYGLFAMLWVLGKRDARFYEAVDNRVAVLFVVWFFLCIALTATGTWNVGNYAHGMGAVLGALAGLAVAEGQWRRRILYAGLALAAVLLVIPVERAVKPYVESLVGASAQELAWSAYRKLEEGDFEEAAALYRKAVAADGRQSKWWYNLGVTYQRLGKHQDMLAAFERALELEPDNALYQDAVTQWRKIMIHR